MSDSPRSSWPISRPKILRFLAYLATAALISGWLWLAAGHSWHAITALFIAFVVGVSSCERMGGISAFLAALTLIGGLVLSAGRP